VAEESFWAITGGEEIPLCSSLDFTWTFFYIHV
jgi:hypothetical protein